MLQGLDSLCYDMDRLKKLGVFSLEKAPERPYCSLSACRGSLEERQKNIFMPRAVVPEQGTTVPMCIRAGLDWTSPEALTAGLNRAWSNPV